MKTFAGLKLCGRKPRQTPQVITAISGPRLVGWKDADLDQPQAVDGESARGDRDDAGSQPVEPVDEVDRVRDADHPEGRDQWRQSGESTTVPASGILSQNIVAPRNTRTIAAST